MFKPKTKSELKALVNDSTVNLGEIDTSLITDMSELFRDSERKDFSGIGNWDTSNVTAMENFIKENIEKWNNLLKSN